MNILPVFKPFLIALTATAFASETSPVNAQANPKKVRIGVSETHVGYLPLQVAFHKGYYKDEGIDLGARFATRLAVPFRCQEPGRGRADHYEAAQRQR